MGVHWRSLNANGVTLEKIMTNAQNNESLVIFLRLEGDTAAAFQRYQEDLARQSGLNKSAPIARGLVMHRLRELGYLPKLQSAVEPIETAQAA
jgi:hypothetical protein